jgi:hypothetical protein
MQHMKVRATKTQASKKQSKKVARAGVVRSIRQAITGRKPVARPVAPTAKVARRRQKAA